MNILISGGHFTPALAVIQKLGSSVSILVLGRKNSFEGDSGLSFEYVSCESLNIPFRSIDAGRLQRVFTKYMLVSIIKFPLGLIQSFLILRDFKPDIVLVFGGYIGFTVAISAFVMRIPVILHEQTQKAGLANKCISLFAKKVLISFASSKKYFPSRKIQYTGNPIRSEVFKTIKPLKLKDSIPMIYVSGGGGGSHFINNQVKKILPLLLQKFCVVHQTGDSRTFCDYEEMLEFKKTLSKNITERYIVKKFILTDEIGWVLKKADLVVSRAGINTVCELIALLKPCLLIPLSHGQRSEQQDNAKLVEKVGIGQVMAESEIAAESLYRKIVYLMDHKDEFKRRSSDLSNEEFFHAADKIVDVIHSLYEEKDKEKD